MSKPDILTMPEYGFLIKCVLYGHNSTSLIHQAYRQRYINRITYNEISNKLSKLCNQYKFLKRDQVGKYSKYSINHPYWFEYIQNNFLTRIIKLNNNNGLLIELLKNYLAENLTNPVSIINLINRFMVHCGFEVLRKQGVEDIRNIKSVDFNSLLDISEEVDPEEQKKIEFDLFLHLCIDYIQYRLLTLNLIEQQEIIEKNN